MERYPQPLSPKECHDQETGRNKG